MHRRDFLHPRNVAQAAGQVLGAIAPDEDVPSLSEVALLRLGWRAMATRFEILLSPDAERGCEAGQDAFALLDELEDQMSVYRDHSEICRINRTASRQPVRVESRLFALLQTAQQVWRETDGAFDMTSHALIRAWGFFRGPRCVPTAEERSAALECVGTGHITFNEQKKSIRFAREGIAINLGSIGKGYALDRLVERLTISWNLSSALLHGGSSSVYAIECPPDDERGWLVRVRHPWQRDRFLGQLWLRNQALGTSAATFQHLLHEGKKLGHILDPRTGWPASGLASVSVIAPTAALADALSTAFYVGGLDVARRYCRTHPEIGAVILPEDDNKLEIIGLNLDQIQS